MRSGAVTRKLKKAIDLTESPPNPIPLKERIKILTAKMQNFVEDSKTTTIRVVAITHEFNQITKKLTTKHTRNINKFYYQAAFFYAKYFDTLYLKIKKQSGQESKEETLAHDDVTILQKIKNSRQLSIRNFYECVTKIITSANTSKLILSELEGGSFAKLRELRFHPVLRDIVCAEIPDLTYKKYKRPETLIYKPTSVDAKKTISENVKNKIKLRNKGLAKFNKPPMSEEETNEYVHQLTHLPSHWTKPLTKTMKKLVTNGLLEEDKVLAERKIKLAAEQKSLPSAHSIALPFALSSEVSVTRKRKNESQDDACTQSAADKQAKRRKAERRNPCEFLSDNFKLFTHPINPTEVVDPPPSYTPEPPPPYSAT
jgi:hypothetical protein